MLVHNSHLIGTPVLSLQTTGPVATVVFSIVDPATLKIIAFRVAGPAASKTATNILSVDSIREYSQLGIVIDSLDDLATEDDIVKISDVLALNFDLIDLKVETKKGHHLGKITDYTVTDDNFSVQQLITQRPFLKSFLDPTLLIPRQEIVEVTDYKVIVKHEEKVIKERALKEDFIPNFVNPFRTQERAPSPSHTETPADTDTE